MTEIAQVHPSWTRQNRLCIWSSPDFSIAGGRLKPAALHAMTKKKFLKILASCGFTPYLTPSIIVWLYIQCTDSYTEVPVI